MVSWVDEGIDGDAERLWKVRYSGMQGTDSTLYPALSHLPPILWQVTATTKGGKTLPLLSFSLPH